MEIVAAVVCEAGQDFSIETLTLDEPRPDEILIRIVATGLCHTDLSFRDQVMPIKLPAVLGHEGSGIVERIGVDVTTVSPGDHVVLTFRSCGVCARCAAGARAYCQQMSRLNSGGARPDGSTSIQRDGDAVSSNFFGQSSFGTFAIAYEDNVVKVDSDLPIELLGPLGCGIQTGAGSVLRALRCSAGSSILITGGGSVGLSALMGAVVAGCSIIIVSDPILSRRQLAAELGATNVFDPAEGELDAFVMGLTGVGCDYAIDTTGNRDVMARSLDCLRPNGTLGLVGIPAALDTPTPGLAVQILSRGYTIRGIIEGDSDPQTFIPELVSLYKAGRFPFDKLIRTYPLNAINIATREQHDGLCIKPVLLMASAQGS